MADYRR